MGHLITITNGTVWSDNAIMFSNEADGMANSVDPYPTALLESDLIWVCTVDADLAVCIL